MAKAPKNIHRLTTLAQMKALADPRRVRILEQMGEERTTKQVAEILGEPPTRLYHHVAALERAGLIRLARTRQSRGAMEKYFVAVAKAFSADPRLFSSRRSSRAKEATQDIATQYFDRTAEEMRALIDEGESAQALQEAGVLGFLEVHGTSREIEALRAKIAKLIESITAGKSKGAPSGRPYRLTIAYFPLPSRTGPS